MKTITITFECKDCFEEEEAVRATRANDAFNLIYEIDQKCRGILKYNENRTAEFYEKELEEIREMICDSGLMEFYS